MSNDVKAWIKAVHNLDQLLPLLEMTTAELAEKSGIPEAEINAFVYGKNPMPVGLEDRLEPVLWKTIMINRCQHTIVSDLVSGKIGPHIPLKRKVVVNKETITLPLFATHDIVEKTLKVLYPSVVVRRFVETKNGMLVVLS